ncbi:MAG: hypothetical protein ICV72_09780 [Aldersonia sp.]|nr:hypothetical protein [Aldersonia sp.]
MSDAAVFRTRVEGELRRAMRDRDAITVTALRSVLSAVDNASAVDASAHDPSTSEVPRRRVDLAEVRAIVQRIAEEHEAAARHYTDLGQHETATRLLREAASARRCLDAE